MSNQAVLTVIKKGLERAGKYIRMRPLCVKCSKRPSAVNYKKGNKTYYRKQCEMCLKYGGPSGYQPKWYIAGYRTKTKCDKCGHTSKYKQQFNVFHVDSNLNNCRFNNLKTVCANCQRSLHLEGVRWQQGDLVPDF